MTIFTDHLVVDTCDGEANAVLDVDIRRLAALDAVARTGTMVGAARVLQLTPQAVSQQLTALARELGVELTRPRGRGIELTDAARTVLHHAELVEAQLDRLDAELDVLRSRPRRLPTARVTVASFSTALFALALPAIAEGRERFPDLDYRAVQALPPQVLTQLSDGSVDIALIADTALEPFGDARFERHDIGRDHFSVAVPRDHPLAASGRRDEPVALDALRDEDWIFAATDLCQGVGRAACRSAGFLPRRTHNFEDWESTLRAVSLGLGVAMVPQLAHSHLVTLSSSDQFVLLRLADARPYRTVFALVRRGGTPAAVSELIEAMRATASDELAEAPPAVTD